MKEKAGMYFLAPAAVEVSELGSSRKIVARSKPLRAPW